MIRVLYKIEIYKMVKRLATWITFICFTAIIIPMFGSLYYDAQKYDNINFGFPDAWPAILVIPGAPTINIFSAVLIVLLVSSEFDWRTSRQNIIDGLSKDQWFVAKMLLLPTIALLF